MKSITILGGLCILIALYVFFGGVRLTVENQSGQTIYDVEIEYDLGSFLSESIPYKEIRKKYLGTLLEDSTFNVKWRENSGRIYRAQFSVYLGFFGSDSILIKILPNGEVDFEQRF